MVQGKVCPPGRIRANLLVLGPKVGYLSIYYTSSPIRAKIENSKKKKTKQNKNKKQKTKNKKQKTKNKTKQNKQTNKKQKTKHLFEKHPYSLIQYESSKGSVSVNKHNSFLIILIKTSKNC